MSHCQCIEGVWYKLVSLEKTGVDGQIAEDSGYYARLNADEGLMMVGLVAQPMGYNMGHIYSPFKFTEEALSTMTECLLDSYGILIECCCEMEPMQSLVEKASFNFFVFLYMWVYQLK